MAAVCVLSGSVRVAEDEVRVFLIDKAAFPPCVAVKDIFSSSCLVLVALPVLPFCISSSSACSANAKNKGWSGV